MARKKPRKRQPPVSLHPLEPEDALAGLMQVKPERKTEGMEVTEDDEKEKPEEQS